jgi:predicted NBD/HSP70 family sugar kinase
MESSNLMKSNNRFAIFRSVTARKKALKSEIQLDTSLSWGSVSESVTDLVSRHILCYGESVQPNIRGPLATYIEVDPHYYAVLAMDLNREGLKAYVMNLRGEILDSVTEPLDETDCATFLTHMESVLTKENQKALSLSLHPFAIGIAVQGSVDTDHGISHYFPGFAPNEWLDVPLKQMVEERFHLPCFMEHDPQCILFAYREKTKEKDGVLIRLDRGIGMAVMEKGVIQEGKDCYELGHTLAVENGRPCVCGRKGCLEAYASLRGIAKEAGVSVDALLEHPENYEALFHDAGHKLGVAFYNVYRLLQNDKFLLCGDTLKAKEYFIPQVKDTLRSLMFPETREISFVEIEEDAAQGAGYWAIDRYLVGLLS